MPSFAVEQYKNQAINSMTNGELLVLLFDEALKNLKTAVMMVEQNNKETFDKCTEKSKNIFNYLNSILDRKYTLSADLYKMYYFFNQEIISAEIKYNSKPIEDIIPLIEDLRHTWAEANRLTHIKN